MVATLVRAALRVSRPPPPAAASGLADGLGPEFVVGDLGEHPIEQKELEDPDDGKRAHVGTDNQRGARDVGQVVRVGDVAGDRGREEREPYSGE